MGQDENEIDICFTNLKGGPCRLVAGEKLAINAVHLFLELNIFSYECTIYRVFLISLFNKVSPLKIC